MQLGQHDEATRILEPVMSETKTVLTSSPTDVAATAKLAECLVVLKKADDAHRLLSAVNEKTASSRVPRDPGLAALYGQSCLIRYDQMTSYRPLNPVRPAIESATVSVPSDLDFDVAIELLTDAMECPATTSMAIDRLSLLSLSDHPSASRVEEVIRQIRLEGDHGAAVLNHLGTHALILKRYEKARNYLELANTQSRGRNPMVLNNLATCLVRTSKNGSETLQRSLELANATLAILPDHPDALSTRGEVYVAMQQWNDAIADLSQSLTFRRRNPDVHRLLETAYRAINDIQMADEHAKRAAELENSQTRS
jgi:tetratricopeptide (TPR) repeat protein